MKALITRKVGMTSIITDDGSLVPVTLLSASPCVVTQVKTAETDGYTAVQLGFEEGKQVGKAQAGHFKKSGITPKVVREFRVDEIEEGLAAGSTPTARMTTLVGVKTFRTSSRMSPPPTQKNNIPKQYYKSRHLQKKKLLKLRSNIPQEKLNNLRLLCFRQRNG
jgi:hypothetical protein